MTPFMLQWQIEVESKHFLALDNSYASLIRKTVGVNVKYQRRLTPQDKSQLAAPFESIREVIANTFENADFDIHVKPCGTSNAYSDRRTGDITICTEIMSDMLRKRGAHGALFGTLFHEYGHSLLNRWGEPGSSEEDMADQFATVSLLRGGDKCREQLLQWIEFWTQQDSRAEAQTQLQRSSPHSLSIQRARNIQHGINFPEEISRRWNKMLYRHMTRQALEKIISQPKRMDDIDLAQDALLAK